MKVILFLLIPALQFISCGTDSAQKVNGQSVQQSTQKQVQKTQQNNSYEDDLIKIFLVYKNLHSPNKDLVKIEQDMKAISTPSLSLAARFMSEYVKHDHKLLTHQFLAKPDIETLKAMFLVKKLMWGSFSMGDVDEKEILAGIDINKFSEDELLASYYSMLFTKLGSQFILPDFSDLNFDLEKLNLKTEKEKGIFFLTSMTAFGKKYQVGMRKTKDPMNDSEVLLASLPKVNGNEYLAFPMPIFDDFTMELTNAGENNSFKNYYEALYESVTKTYKKVVFYREKEGRN